MLVYTRGSGTGLPAAVKLNKIERHSFPTGSSGASFGQLGPDRGHDLLDPTFFVQLQLWPLYSIRPAWSLSAGIITQKTCILLARTYQAMC